MYFRWSADTQKSFQYAHVNWKYFTDDGLVELIIQPILLPDAGDVWLALFSKSAAAAAAAARMR